MCMVDLDKVVMEESTGKNKHCCLTPQRGKASPAIILWEYLNQQ